MKWEECRGVLKKLIETQHETRKVLQDGVLARSVGFTYETRVHDSSSYVFLIMIRFQVKRSTVDQTEDYYVIIQPWSNQMILTWPTMLSYSPSKVLICRASSMISPKALRIAGLIVNIMKTKSMKLNTNNFSSFMILGQ